MTMDPWAFWLQKPRRRGVKICCQCCNLFIYFSSYFFALLLLSRRAQKCTYKPTHGLVAQSGDECPRRGGGQRVHIVYFTHLLGRGRYCAGSFPAASFGPNDPLVEPWVSSSSPVSIPSPAQLSSAWYASLHFQLLHFGKLLFIFLASRLYKCSYKAV